MRATAWGKGGGKAGGGKSNQPGQQPPAPPLTEIQKLQHMVEAARALGEDDPLFKDAYSRLGHAKQEMEDSKPAEQKLDEKREKLEEYRKKLSNKLEYCTRLEEKAEEARRKLDEAAQDVQDTLDAVSELEASIAQDELTLPAIKKLGPQIRQESAVRKKANEVADLFHQVCTDVHTQEVINTLMDGVVRLEKHQERLEELRRSSE